MSVANSAELLCRRGLKVLIIDFDLEAPGLEGFFNTPESTLSPTAVLDRRGVIDMLLSYKELHSLPHPDPVVGTLETSPNPNPFPFPIEPLANFIVPLYEENSDGGALFLIPAGRRGGD